VGKLYFDRDYDGQDAGTAHSRMPVAIAVSERVDRLEYAEFAQSGQRPIARRSAHIRPTEQFGVPSPLRQIAVVVDVVDRGRGGNRVEHTQRRARGSGIGKGAPMVRNSFGPAAGQCPPVAIGPMSTFPGLSTIRVVGTHSKPKGLMLSVASDRAPASTRALP